MSGRVERRGGPAPAAEAGEIRFGDRIVAYALNRRRRRSIGFVVGPGGLTVHAPGWLGPREIEAALVSKSRWIVAKLDEQRDRAARDDAARIEWRDGCRVPYLGAALRIELAGPGRGATLRPSEDVTDGDPVVNDAAEAPPSVPVLRLPLEHDASTERIESAVRRWLQSEARRIFAERCRLHAPRLGVQPSALRLSSARTRWGSASADRTIRLNWRLVLLPLAAIDYVVVHELAHLREMNHGPRFWSIVRDALPGYEALRRELRAVRLPAI